MGSTSIASNGKIWFDVIREAYEGNENALEWADSVYAGIATLAKDRNDYLHTLYAHRDSDDPADFDVCFSHDMTKEERAKIPAAIKVRTEKPVSLSDLRRARDHAAHLSIIVAHFEWDLLEIDVPNPFSRRLARLPLLPPHTPRAGRAKERQPRQKSSAE